MTLYAFYEDQDNYYLVMELLPHGTLLDWVGRHGPLPPRLATRAVLQVCRGVAAAHSAGVVHRDIKPHNVLITDEGDCKLADFGIARANDEDQLTRTGSTMGTLGYMPPEQRKDAKSVDARADIYSLGATLWGLLMNETVVDLFLCEDDPTRLAGIPRPLRAPIRTAVAYARDDRQPDIATLIGDLEYAFAQLPPDPSSPPLVEALASAMAEEVDGFPELALLFGDGSLSSTPELTDAHDTGSKALPYFMPATGQRRISLPPDSTPAAARAGAKRDDTLPDYVDRESLSEDGRYSERPSRPERRVSVSISSVDSSPAPRPTAPTPLIAAAVAGVIGTVLVVWLLSAANGLLHARADALAAREALYAELNGLGPVVDDLTRRGVPRDTLEGPYFAFLDTKAEPARARAARQLATTLQDAADQSPHSAAVEDRLVRLETARSNFLRTLEVWQVESSGIPGGVLHAVGIGAAELPGD